jgi:hypothetical protein
MTAPVLQKQTKKFEQKVAKETKGGLSFQEHRVILGRVLDNGSMPEDCL